MSSLGTSKPVICPLLASAARPRCCQAASATAIAPGPATTHTSVPSDEVLVDVQSVYKAFGSKQVLRGASFNIKRGEAVGIIGGSGTGKSTTLRLIAGLLQPDAGKIIIKGQERQGLISDSDESSYGIKLGLVFQNAALFDSLTVMENVGFQLFEHSDMSRSQIEQVVVDNLNKVGLQNVEHMPPSQLSGGMKKRVALARAITAEMDAGDEKVIMYDEPTAGLDPVASTVVEDLMRSMHTPRAAGAADARGGVASYIVVTHQHSTIRRAVDRLVFLHEGSVVWQGPTAEFDETENAYVKQFAQGLLEGPIQYF